MPPLLALLGGVALFLCGGNASLLRFINGWSAWSGDALWADLTVLGNGVVVLALLLPWLSWRPSIARAGFIAAVPAGLWAGVLKPLFNVPRPPAVLSPEALHVIGPALRAHAFPSGHTTAIFAFAAVLALSLRGPPWRWALLTLAVLVGLSRCVVGVHWPLDVFGGAFGGWLSGWAGVALEKRWRTPLSRRPVGFVMGLVCLGACFSLYAWDAGYALARAWLWVLASSALISWGLGAFPIDRRKKT